MSRTRTSIVIGLSMLGTLTLAAGVFALTSTNFAIGTIPFLESLSGPAQVTMQHLVLAPGDVVSWHYHTGDVFVVQKAGVLTEIGACEGANVVNAGDAFHEPAGRIHRVENNGTDPVDLYSTYIVPAGHPRTVFVSEPICIGPPATADDCKTDQWQSFTVPRVFRNQGECVSFVQSSKP